jgi:putative peptidoglycan lipid II flippase
MDTIQTILRSAKSFFAGTALSRISGLFRDIAMAISFGSSPEIAAFMVAYRLANLFRRLLGEGNLQAGFVPHFVSLKEESGPFFRDTVYSMGVILLTVIGFLEFLLWKCKEIVSDSWIEIIELTMWMVPGLFFICLYGLNSSLLQCRKKYFTASVAPVVFNLIWIMAVWIYPNAYFLAIAITAAFAGQWLVTSFEGWKLLSLKEWIKPHFFSPQFIKVCRPLLLGIIGIGAVQFNSALDALFARIADLKGPAYLWYAIRIQQLPLALFGMALAGALLPSLSRTQDPIHRQTLLQGALKRAAALMLVCTGGILCFSEEGIRLLYGHGDFSLTDVQETTRCLWAYGAGLLPSVFVLILAARFYAEKNYRLPMMASLISVGVNVGLNALFVFGLKWGAVSIAIATSISSLVNAILLSKNAFTQAFWAFFFKILMACTCSFVLVFGLQHTWGSFTDLFMQILQLATLGIIYLGSVAAFGLAFGLKQSLQDNL